MKTLKLVLIVIGLGFLIYALYSIFGENKSPEEVREQLYAMMAVGVLFMLAGFSLGRR